MFIILKTDYFLQKWLVSCAKTLLGLSHYWSDKGFKGIVVNQALPSFFEGSLKTTLIYNALNHGVKYLRKVLNRNIPGSLPLRFLCLVSDNCPIRNVPSSSWNNLVNIKYIMKPWLRNELSLCHKLEFSNPYIFATHCRWP